MERNEPLCYLDDLFEDVKDAVSRGEISEIAGMAIDLATCNKAILERLEPLKVMLRDYAREQVDGTDLPNTHRIDADYGGHCVVTFPAKQLRMTKDADPEYLLEKLGQERFDTFFETKVSYKPRSTQPFMKIANSFNGTPELLNDVLSAVDMIEPTARVSFKDSS